MIENHRLKYMAINPADRKWGIVVNSVGYQLKGASMEHPVGIHPKKYLFSPTEGRVLQSFQIHLFLTEGEGAFRSSATGMDREIILREGDMFLLFPGVWHTYYPVGGSSWNEFWIDFEGSIPAGWMERSLLSPGEPIFKVGIREGITVLFKDAIDLAMTQKAGYQPLLGSIAHHILCSAMYYDKYHCNSMPSADRAIGRARVIVDQQLATIDPETMAAQVGIGYSKFRKMFREYTGFSPGQYIAEMKMNRAKEMLQSTEMSVKEIALSLGYEDYDYFTTAFKRHTGMRPSEYRESWS